jgi:hypothetical protein
MVARSGFDVRGGDRRRAAVRPCGRRHAQRREVLQRAADADGAAFLTDFGIAVAGADPLLDGGPQRNDLRDLAWLVWELLTGSRPPSGRASAYLRASEAGDPPDEARRSGGSRGLAFWGPGTADGSLFAMSGGDRVAAFYDVASGVQLGGPITIAADERSSVRLSIDGRRLAVGGQAMAFDDVVRGDRIELNGAQIWDLDPSSWIRAACGVPGRNLTREEWEAHIGDLAPYRSTCPGQRRADRAVRASHSVRRG